MAAKENGPKDKCACACTCNSNGSHANGEHLRLEMVEEAAAYVRTRFPKPDFAPQVAIVCGSGLGAVAELMTDSVAVKYSEVPHFPASTVKGHAGVHFTSLHLLPRRLLHLSLSFICC